MRIMIGVVASTQHAGRALRP